YKGMGLTSLVMQGLSGILMIGFASSRVLWLSEILLFVFGLSLITVFSTVTSLVQLIAPDELRGRVMSIYMVAFRGGIPVGSLISGYVASRIGAPAVLIFNGIMLALVAKYFFIRSKPV